MIEIQQLQDFNLEQVINLLLEEKKQPFEIYIPKKTRKFFSDTLAISMDYASLAYSGQLLFDIADEFEYEKTPPEDHDSVLFTLKTKDIERLASTLLEISYGYVNDNPDDEDPNFAELFSNYLYEIEKGKIPVIACPYFVDVNKEFEEEEENTDDS